MNLNPPVWPLLRSDLTLHLGPTDSNGSPTWTLHDPARNQYFAIDWLSFEIISRLEFGNFQKIIEALESETTLNVGIEEIEAVIQFLDANELVERFGAQYETSFKKKYELRQRSWLEKILHSYLFFRLALIRPDNLLEKLLNYTQFFYSRRFFQITGIVFVTGLWGVYRQWDVFQVTLVNTFSLEGLLGYGIALISVKIIHELGHAFTAKRLGCRVPTMGIAFLVMWPMAYTDVTESWKLNSNHKRFLIASAGIITELIVAMWMLLAWVFLPDGNLRGIAFFLATTSIVATLVINASPFMRFDGYYLLCDYLGRPNLHPRSFSYARWWLREQLFGLGDVAPEDVNRSWHRFYIIFAITTWLYRLILFLGIALLIYGFFFKALGIALLVIEIWYFILRPIWLEIKVWKNRWGKIKPVLQERPNLYLLIVGLLFVITPFDVTVNSQGMLKPERSLNVFAHRASQIEKISSIKGQFMLPGEKLISLYSPELTQKIQLTKIKVNALEKEYTSAGFSQNTIKQQAILREQYVSAKEELNGLLLELERLHPKTPFAGVIIDVQPDLHLGQWIPKGMSLVKVIDEKNWVVDTYVEESDLRRLAIGNWGWFIPEPPGLPDVRLEIVAIDRDASRVLPESALGSIAGGTLIVRSQGNKLYPERAVYRVRLKAVSLDKTLSTGHLRGRIVILAWPKSVMGDVLRAFLATVIRESNF